jgi:hypothetical protein
VRVAWFSTRRLLLWASALLLLACLAVDVSRHVMPKAYLPVVVGLCLIALSRYRATVAALGVAAVLSLAVVVAGWGVPLGPDSVAARAAQVLPWLGEHPYCFHDRYIQGLFGRTYDCYRHYVIPGKISSGDANYSVAVRASDSGITFVFP